MKRHLSQDDLLVQLYGVGGQGFDQDDVHLRECAECAARLEAMVRTKAGLRAEAEARTQVSSGFLAAQRRSIYSRLDAAASSVTASYVRWAPALAGAGLLAVGLLFLPHPQAINPHAPDAAVAQELTSEEKLVSDLYSMEQSFEPSADAPIHELFDEGSGAGEQ